MDKVEISDDTKCWQNHGATGTLRTFASGTLDGTTTFYWSDQVIKSHNQPRLQVWGSGFHFLTDLQRITVMFSDQAE